MKTRKTQFRTRHDGNFEPFAGDILNSHGTADFSHDSPTVSSGRANILDHRVARILLQLLGQPEISMILWDGTIVSSSSSEPIASLRFRDRSSLYLTLLRPELNFGDLYSAGRVEIDGDLNNLLEVVYQGLQRGEHWRFFHWMNRSLGHRKIRNGFRRAADNIHHHYDIGNDFYQLWLDQEAMQYTCAYYPEADMTLEQAQIAKMRHVCRKLQLKPGDQIVEAGCGWGGFALYMAKNHDVRVKAYNISREQVKYAREKAESQGLDDRVDYVLDDYRNIKGKYDVFVSVGMLEHVGPEHFPVLGQVIDRCLKPAGRGLIHSIGRNCPKPMNAWIERRIFPGAYPPALGEMMSIFESSRLSVLDLENLRLHYARTLEAWSQRFEQHSGQVEKMMDRQFVRAWRLYLAGSRAAFTSGNLQLFQILFTRETNNNIPWSRAHQYSTQTRESITDRAVMDA